MNLYLVRHANPQIDPTVAACKWRLSTTGLKRAGELAKLLTGRGIQGVVSSGEPKAVETAQILAEQLGMQVEIGEGLQEHERPLTPGSFTSKEAFQAQVKMFFAHPGQLSLGRETAEQCFERFDRAVHKVIASHPGKTLVLVTHGTVLSLFLSRYNHLDGYAFWQALGMPTCIQITMPDFNIGETWELPERLSLETEEDQ